MGRYEENSKILASAPEAAGDRLKTALEELNDDLGAILRPIGVQFQTLADDIVKHLKKKEIRKNGRWNSTRKKINRFVRINQK